VKGLGDLIKIEIDMNNMMELLVLDKVGLIREERELGLFFYRNSFNY
jgi:hypothetical protein